MADVLRELEKLPQISVRDLRRQMKEDAAPLVVDVRTPTEWKSNHIEGARHLPLSSFAQRGTELPNEQPIAIICGSGYRSSIASSLLQARGYKNLANVAGGMSAYTEAPE